jgi:hypothetical protein
MQAVRKHTAIIKMRGRLNYSLLPAVFASIPSRSEGAPGTLKFRHVW